MDDRRTPTVRTSLHSILHPIATFIDEHLQLVRATTIVTFSLLTLVTIRNLKGVRTYVSASSIPKNIYGDHITGRIVAASDTLHLEHRPFMGILLHNIQNIFLVHHNGTNSDISMRPHGVHLVTGCATTATTPSAIDNALLLTNPRVKEQYNTWVEQEFIRNNTNVLVEPIYLEEQTTIVAHCHAKLYYSDKHDTSAFQFTRKLFKTNINLSIVLLEMGFGLVAVEEEKTGEDRQWMQILMDAEDRAKKDKVGIWKYYVEMENDAHKDNQQAVAVDQGSLWNRLKQKLVPDWWAKLFG